MSTLGLMFCFGGVTGATYLAIQCLGSKETRVEERIRELAGEVSLFDSLREACHKLLDQTLGGVVRQYRDVGANRDSFKEQLAAAGVYSRNGLTLFLVSRLVLLVLPALACAALAVTGRLGWRPAVMIGSLSGLVAIIAPGIWLKQRIAKRARTITQSMTDFLDLSIVCLDGGLSLQATLRRVSEEIHETHPELGHEMAIVLRDVDMGITIREAVRQFADRCGVDVVRTFATFIRETQRFGTPLSAAMRDLAETLRVHAEHAAEERAQKAAVKILLPTLLFLFPAVFVVVVGPAVLQIYEAFSP